MARGFFIPGFLAAITGACIACSAGSPPDSPVSVAQQLILVIAETDTSTQASLLTFNREGTGWKQRASRPAVIGRNGMAWGRGVHDDADRAPGEPVKREGDGKTPAGAFELPLSFGYPPADSVRTRLPYTRATPDLICIDDVSSEFYNLVIDLRERNLDSGNLPSHEEMLRQDELYRYVIVVGHNFPDPEPSAGSCIFLHLWRGAGSFTAGCAAISEGDMIDLLEWLDPSARPVIVQLTRSGYERLKVRWDLPETTPSF